MGDYNIEPKYVSKRSSPNVNSDYWHNIFKILKLNNIQNSRQYYNNDKIATWLQHNQNNVTKQIDHIYTSTNILTSSFYSYVINDSNQILQHFNTDHRAIIILINRERFQQKTPRDHGFRTTRKNHHLYNYNSMNDSKWDKFSNTCSTNTTIRINDQHLMIDHL